MASEGPVNAPQTERIVVGSAGRHRFCADILRFPAIVRFFGFEEEKFVSFLVQQHPFVIICLAAYLVRQELLLCGAQSAAEQTSQSRFDCGPEPQLRGQGCTSVC